MDGDDVAILCEHPLCNNVSGDSTSSAKEKDDTIIIY